MPARTHSFADAVDRAVATAQPVPRGIAFRATIGHDADAAAAVREMLPGWEVLPVAGLPGRYEALHLVGELEGHPVITFTSPEPADVPTSAPSSAYLGMVARGLRETHEHTDDQLVDYLVDCPGVAPEWSRSEVADLVAA